MAPRRPPTRTLPLRWVVLAIVIFIRGYTFLRLHYGKRGSRSSPITTWASRRGPAPAGLGYQRIPAELERPAEPLAAAGWPRRPPRSRTRSAACPRNSAARCDQAGPAGRGSGRDRPAGRGRRRPPTRCSSPARSRTTRRRSTPRLSLPQGTASSSSCPASRRCRASSSRARKREHRPGELFHAEPSARALRGPPCGGRASQSWEFTVK